MRLVFTKLETPAKNILVDLGTGTFEEFSLQDLQDSETGKYLQLPDTIPANSIRVKANSSELGSFDMIKEYQITDDEGNIIGGIGDNLFEIKTIDVYLDFCCHNYSLVFSEEADALYSDFLNTYSSVLYLLIDNKYYGLDTYIPEEIKNKIDSSLFYLKYQKSVNNGSIVEMEYLPIPYKFNTLGFVQK